MCGDMQMSGWRYISDKCKALTQFLSDLDNIGGEIEIRYYINRAALEISAEMVLIARAECTGCALTSGWRYFQRMYVDVVRQM